MSERLNARVRLLPTGRHYYWEQYPQLKSVGYGDHSQALETFAEAIGFEIVRV